MTIDRSQYSVSLRVLGHLLDQERARMVTICEIDQGFLTHYFPQDNPSQVRTHVLHGAEMMNLEEMLDYQPPGGNKGRTRGWFNGRGNLQKFLKTHPLLPTGYEPFLHALGLKLDGRSAESTVFTETSDAVHVDYTIPRADLVVRNGGRMILDGRRSDRYTRSQAEGLVEQAETRTRERVRSATQHLSSNPLDTSAHLELARAFDDYGARREAKDMYTRVTQLAPQQSEAYYQLARHARRRGDRKGALKYIQQAVTINSEDGRFLHLLGRLNIERDHLDSAVTALERAIAIESSNPMYHYDLSRAYEKQGRIEAARAALAGFDARLAPVYMGSPAVASVPITPASPTEGTRRQALGSRLNRRLGQMSLETAPPTSEPSTTDQTSSATPPDILASPAFLSPSSADFPSTADTIHPPIPTSDDWPPSAPLEQQWSVQQNASPGGAMNLEESSNTPSTAAENTRTAQPRIAPSPRERDLDLKSAPLHPLPDAEGSVRVDARTHADDEAQIAAAVVRAQEMVLAEPRRADLHRRLGFLLAKQGRNEEAALEFRRAAEAGRRNLFA